MAGAMGLLFPAGTDTRHLSSGLLFLTIFKVFLYAESILRHSLILESEVSSPSCFVFMWEYRYDTTRYIKRAWPLPFPQDWKSSKDRPKNLKNIRKPPRTWMVAAAAAARKKQAAIPKGTRIAATYPFQPQKEGNWRGKYFKIKRQTKNKRERENHRQNLTTN